MAESAEIRRARFILDRVARNLQGQAEGHVRGVTSVDTLRQACLTAAAEVLMVKDLLAGQERRAF